MNRRENKYFSNSFYKYIILLTSILLLGNKILAKDKLIISAIPDQNPERLNRLYSSLADEISEQLNIVVIYKPVINYQAAVSAFRTNNLDLVWFGGLTGVQARLQRPGSIIIAQRDIDTKFQSIFIANTRSEIQPIANIKGLKVLKGRRFTFGSESSTSGRLMPQHFLNKANVKLSDFKAGVPGFSGSHDATIALVESGTYEAGVLNLQVWNSRIDEAKVNTNKVIPIWKTPTYSNYHWLAQPNLDQRFGKGFSKKLKKVILSLNPRSSRQNEILKMFSANRFIKAYPKQYKGLEEVGRELNKIR